MKHDRLEEYRCRCGKLLCKSLLVHGIIEIKCKSCHEIVRFAMPEISYIKKSVAQLTAQQS